MMQAPCGLTTPSLAPTAAMQAYQVRDANEDAEFELQMGGPFRNFDGGIYTAARSRRKVRDAAKARYGPIAPWDTLEVTYFPSLFED
jgi:hypothetical protein